jgi:hypothetical protein
VGTGVSDFRLVAVKSRRLRGSYFCYSREVGMPLCLSGHLIVSAALTRGRLTFGEGSILPKLVCSGAYRLQGGLHPHAEWRGRYYGGLYACHP